MCCGQVIKSAKAGELDAFRAIVMHHEADLPGEVYLEIFQICCKNAGHEKVKNMLSRKPKHRGHLPFLSGKSLESAVEVVFTSLWVIGSKKMGSEISKRWNVFAPAIREHWGSLFLTMIEVFKLSKSTDSCNTPGAPRANLDILSILCNVMTVLFTNSALHLLIDTSTIFFQKVRVDFVAKRRSSDARSAIESLQLVGDPLSFAF